MSQQTIDLSEAEEIHFTVKSEPWVKFKLEDGTLLLARMITTKIFKVGQNEKGEPMYQTPSSITFTTYPPKGLRGKPSVPLPTSINPDDFETTTLMRFEQMGEKCCCYELEDGIILLSQLILNWVRKTDKFSVDGDPYYIVNFGAAGTKILSIAGHQAVAERKEELASESSKNPTSPAS